MCDRKWETNCSNSILNLGHVSIDPFSPLYREKSLRGCSRLTLHRWLLPSLSFFFSPLFSALSSRVAGFPGNGVIHRRTSWNNELDGRWSREKCTYEWMKFADWGRFLKNSWRDTSFFFFVRYICPRKSVDMNGKWVEMIYIYIWVIRIDHFWRDCINVIFNRSYDFFKKILTISK